MSEFPKHIACTKREWKARKRREWREVVRALETFLVGAAYTPIHDKFWALLTKDVRAMTKRLSVKEWGR